MDNKQRLSEKIDVNREKIIDLCNWIREHPEISLEEVESAKKLSQFLRDVGFEVTEQLMGMPTAFKAVKKNGEGPRIAYIAEYDALPGNGHACGHHMIASMSIAAAMALSELLDTFKGEVTIIGTPAEETGHGKPYLIEKGAFEGYDAALMIHPNSTTCLYPEMIAIGGIDFTFTGVPSHAGQYPDKGVNALDAVVLLYNNINALRQQLRDGTRIHGIILEAGSAANVIPDKGRVRLEFRTKEQSYFDEVVEKVIKCAQGAALATGCSLDYEHFEPTCQGLKPNYVVGGIFKKYMEEMNIFESGKVGGSSTDMGNVSQIIPSLHPMFSVTDNGEDIHTQEFLEATQKPLAIDRMFIGAKLLAYTGLELFENPALIEEAKKELHAN